VKLHSTLSRGQGIGLNIYENAVLENPVLFASQKPTETVDFLKPSFALEICNLLMPANRVLSNLTGPRTRNKLALPPQI
jgi:hypothetical protein